MLKSPRNLEDFQPWASKSVSPSASPCHWTFVHLLSQNCHSPNQPFSSNTLFSHVTTVLCSDLQDFLLWISFQPETISTASLVGSTEVLLKDAWLFQDQADWKSFEHLLSLAWVASAPVGCYSDLLHHQAKTAKIVSPWFLQQGVLLQQGFQPPSMTMKLRLEHGYDCECNRSWGKWDQTMSNVLSSCSLPSHYRCKALVHMDAHLFFLPNHSIWWALMKTTRHMGNACACPGSAWGSCPASSKRTMMSLSVSPCSSPKHELSVGCPASPVQCRGMFPKLIGMSCSLSHPGTPPWEWALHRRHSKHCGEELSFPACLWYQATQQVSECTCCWEQCKRHLLQFRSAAWGKTTCLVLELHKDHPSSASTSQTISRKPLQHQPCWPPTANHQCEQKCKSPSGDVWKRFPACGQNQALQAKW